MARCLHLFLAQDLLETAHTTPNPSCPKKKLHRIIQGLRYRIPPWSTSIGRSRQGRGSRECQFKIGAEKRLKQFLFGMASNRKRNARDTSFEGLGYTILVSTSVVTTEEQLKQKVANHSKRRRCYCKNSWARIVYTCSGGEQPHQTSFASNTDP